MFCLQLLIHIQISITKKQKQYLEKSLEFKKIPRPVSNLSSRITLKLVTLSSPSPSPELITRSVQQV